VAKGDGEAQVTKAEHVGFESDDDWLEVRLGLCSVTFRGVGVGAVVDLAAEHGLEGIEWGGDVHVPLGDLRRAGDAAARSFAAGIACPSYGSYLMAGAVEGDQVDAAVETALALGAANLRVWPAWGVGPDAPADDRLRVTRQLGGIADRAAAAGLAVSVEFHPNTLTETAVSATRLLSDLDRANLYTYWQPRPGSTASAALAEYEAVACDCSHLHVFWWDADGERRPLEDGRHLWSAVLADDRERRWFGDRWAFLEFVAGDDPEALAADARTLRYLAAGVPVVASD
jgi:3-dehydroshikimate dehydratase